jgi:hypothetical protein
MAEPTPPFRSGHADLTAGLLNRITAMLQWYESGAKNRRPPVTKIQTKDRANDSFWAVLTGYQELVGFEGHRWKYAWVEAIWDADNDVFIQRAQATDPVSEAVTFQPMNSDGHSQDGHSGTVFGTTAAYNTIENGNDGERIESGGVNVNTAGDYPPLFYLQPIQGDWQPDDADDYNPQTSQTWDVDKGPVVGMYMQRDTDNVVRFIFQAMNQHDGRCP